VYCQRPNSDRLIATQLFLEHLVKGFHSKQPFVAYRKPYEKLATAIFQKNSVLHRAQDYTEKGFVFAPFQKGKAYLTVPDEILHSEFKSQFKQKDSNLFPENLESKKQHIELVSKTISYLKKQEVSKIVMARMKKIEKEVAFEKVFENLLAMYKTAFVYVWYHPKVGMWMGATPETLVSYTEKTFRTMSLAGTQRFVKNDVVDWGEKEKEEQQMVTDYMLSRLNPVCEVLDFSDVETVKAGDLLHLKTTISGRLKQDFGLKEIVGILHPTPAVCGFPTEKSFEFIVQNESFDRKFYTGFLGEINLTKTSNLYVNLRCIEVLNKKQLNLYVGGGITVKSVAQKEWEETVSKTKTMECCL
jgi:isochorismate synthase